MSAFVHPAVRRAYGAALTEEQKAQYRKDVQSGKIVAQKAPPRTAAIAESRRTGVPVEEILAAAAEGMTETLPEDMQTVSGDMADQAATEGGLPWAYIIGGVVLVGGLGFAAWYFTRPKPDASAAFQLSPAA